MRLCRFIIFLDGESAPSEWLESFNFHVLVNYLSRIPFRPVVYKPIRHSPRPTWNNLEEPRSTSFYANFTFPLLNLLPQVRGESRFLILLFHEEREEHRRLVQKELSFDQRRSYFPRHPVSRTTIFALRPRNLRSGLRRISPGMRI